MTRRCVAGLVAGAVTATAVAVAAPAAAQDPAYDVLVFSKTAGFRHDSIAAGVAALQQLGAEHGFTVDATEDAGAFTPANLDRYEAVVFLSTTGDVLDAGQQAAFEQYVRGGGGYAGVHAAADTEYDWPWYVGLVGASFASHPQNQTATIDVHDRAHPSTAHLDREWVRYDEWYNYSANPRERGVHVLATLDESTYSGGTMGADHPIAWCHAYDGGRSWYSGGGHTAESYAEPAFRAHLLGGIRYAAGAANADCRPESGYRSLFDGTSTARWQHAGPGGFVLGADGTWTTTGGLGLQWYSAQEFASYSLKLDWRYGGAGNSGVFVGFPASDDPWAAVTAGYEVQIDPGGSGTSSTGAVYGAQAPDAAARDAAVNDGSGEWNSYEILVEDERLRVFLNGVLVNDFTNPDPARSLGGYVGLQNHTDGDTVSFRDVRIRELGGAETLLSAGRPATASSVEAPGYEPGLATDGDPRTRWSSAFADPQSWTVDLGAVRTVSRVRLDWETAYGSAYAIRTSTDGEQWTTVHTTSTGDGGVDDVRVAATPARFVRVDGTSRGTPWGYSLWSAEVFGS